MSQGVPVVVSRTKIDTLYFDETLVRFFRAGDSADMADAMIEVIKNKELREGLVAAGNQNVQRYSWDLRKNDYLQLIDSLSTHLLGDTKIPAVAPFHGAARSSGGAAESVPGCAPYKFTKAQNS
jgi:hypothetical protein